LSVDSEDHTGKPDDDDDDDDDDGRRHGHGGPRGGKRRCRKHTHKPEDHTADPREPEDHTGGPPDGRGEGPEGFRPERFGGPRERRQKGSDDHTAGPELEDHTGRFEGRDEDDDGGRRGRGRGRGRGGPPRGGFWRRFFGGGHG